MADGQTCLKGVKILTSPSSKRARPAPRRWHGLAPRWSSWRTREAAIPARTGRHGRHGRSVFPAVQRQQEVDHGQPEGPEGLALVKDLASQGRRDGGEFRPRRDRAAGPWRGRDPQAQPVDHLLPGQGLRRGQPVREEPRVRHDRAGLRRHDEHHRRARRPPAEAGPVAGRYRHRHAAGDLHSRRAVSAQGDRPGRSPAGGDAGCDAALHPHRVRRTAPHRQGGAARGGQQRVRRQSTDGHVPVQGRRAERLRLCLHQPRQSRSLAAPAGGDRPRGSGRRRALRNPRRARRTPARGERHDRRLDEAAHQA